MPKKKNKLWIKINQVVERSNSFLGDRFLVKISGTDKQVWVQERDLSDGVISDFKSDKTLSKTAQARVNRVHADKQREYFEKHSATEDVSPTLDPVKWSKRAAKWIVMAQLYVEEINKVMRLKAQLRPAAIQKLHQNLKPAQGLRANLTTDRFLEGFVIWNNSKQSVIQTTEGQVGYLTCTVCEKDYKWPSCERACKHVTSLGHHRQGKIKLDANRTAGSRQNLHEACATATGPCELVKCVC